MSNGGFSLLEDSLSTYTCRICSTSFDIPIHIIDHDVMREFVDQHFTENHPDHCKTCESCFKLFTNKKESNKLNHNCDNSKHLLPKLLCNYMCKDLMNITLEYAFLKRQLHTVQRIIYPIFPVQVSYSKIGYSRESVKKILYSHEVDKCSRI